MKVITGGLLIDGNGLDPVPDASVVIDDDGRIVEAGPLDSFPSGAEVVDVAGKTIMPGIIDCHAHLFVDLKPMHVQALEPMTLRTF